MKNGLFLLMLIWLSLMEKEINNWIEESGGKYRLMRQAVHIILKSISIEESLNEMMVMKGGLFLVLSMVVIDTQRILIFLPKKNFLKLTWGIFSIGLMTQWMLLRLNWDMVLNVKFNLIKFNLMHKEHFQLYR